MCVPLESPRIQASGPLLTITRDGVLRRACSGRLPCSALLQSDCVPEGTYFPAMDTDGARRPAIHREAIQAGIGGIPVGRGVSVTQRPTVWTLLLTVSVSAQRPRPSRDTPYHAHPLEAHMPARGSSSTTREDERVRTACVCEGEGLRAAFRDDLDRYVFTVQSQHALDGPLVPLRVGLLSQGLWVTTAYRLNHYARHRFGLAVARRAAIDLPPRRYDPHRNPHRRRRAHRARPEVPAWWTHRDGPGPGRQELRHLPGGHPGREREHSRRALLQARRSRLSGTACGSARGRSSPET